MRHAREDYEAIQPFPTKRPHHVRVNGELVMEQDVTLGVAMEPIIPDDEPVFIIRAKDVNGPAVVRHWAERAANVEADPELVEKVFAWADEMERYAAENYGGGKRPDTPDGLLK